MQAKHCRHCNTKVPENRGWLENYCCEDHRVAFQERQHKETIERLRREEPDDQLESELALHTFEPRRVRVSMLGDEPGSEFGDQVFPLRGAPSPRAGNSHISRQMPPPVNVQPLVAPPLQQKASVEQSLAALSFVAEPVSAPLDLPQAEGLGASVRRVVTPNGTAPRRNAAIVDLIRGAKERINDNVVAEGSSITSASPMALGVPAPTLEPGPSPMAIGSTPGNGARVRSIAVTLPPPPPKAKPASVETKAPLGKANSPSALPATPQPRTAVVRPSPAVNSFASAPTFSTPSFSALGGNAGSEESNSKARVYGAALGTIALAGGICYFVFGS